MRFLMIPRPSTGGMSTGADGPSCDHSHPAFDEQLAVAYTRYNEAMMKAGVLVAAEGLNPAAPAVQVAASGGKRVVVDGPFAESKELVGGFYLIDVESKEEAIQWALRCPVGLGHEVLEIRQLTELSDLPPPFVKMIVTHAPMWSSSRWKQSAGTVAAN